MEYYSALKRNEILTHAATQMNLEDIMLSEISQSQRTNIVRFQLWGTQNSQIHRNVEWWLPGAVGEDNKDNKELVFNG